MKLTAYKRPELNLRRAKKFNEMPSASVKKIYSIDFIIKKVCEYKRINKRELFLDSRKREIVEARQLAMHFSKEYTRATFETIGKKIGDKDHSTVSHSLNVVQNLAETNKQFAKQLRELEKLF